MALISTTQNGSDGSITVVDSRNLPFSLEGIEFIITDERGKRKETTISEKQALILWVQLGNMLGMDI